MAGMLTVSGQRGQLALDLLLSLLVLLIVLSALGSVLERFESTNKEVSLHQQLRENGTTAQYLLSSSSSYFRETVSYAGDPAIVALTNASLSSPANTPLVALHALKTPQGYSCLSSFDWSDSDASPDTLTFTLPAADTALTNDVTYSLSFYAPEGYQSAHAFSSGQCYGNYSIGVSP